MIGAKKLSTIRQELQRALGATGDDPIRWLETRMALPARRRSGHSAEGQVLQSLRRVLQTPEKTTAPKRKVV